MTELARVRTEITGWPGAPGLMTQYFRKTGGGAWTAYDDLMVGKVDDAWAEIVDIMPPTMVARTLPEIDIIEDTTGEILQTIEASSSQSQTGVASPGWYLPTATGFCVIWRTNGVVNGKHVRGRSFIVPVAANAQESDGTPIATALTFVNSFATTLISGGTSVALAVWSRPKVVPNSDPKAYVRFGSSHLVTSHTLADKFAVLRSRRD
jgi:hypothetical protein